MDNLATAWRVGSVELTQQQQWDLLIASADLAGSLASGAVAVPCLHPSMSDIPAEVACPRCGGYVRGHQWISATSCSIIEVFEEPVKM